jgi:predicted ABC-type sugar transport system permease subunit
VKGKTKPCDQVSKTGARFLPDVASPSSCSNGADALIMACLLNGMTLLAVSPEFKFVARGAVLSLAVWMDVRLGR